MSVSFLKSSLESVQRSLLGTQSWSLLLALPKHCLDRNSIVLPWRSCPLSSLSKSREFLNFSMTDKYSMAILCWYWPLYIRRYKAYLVSGRVFAIDSETLSS